MENKKESKLWRSKLIGNDAYLLRIDKNYFIDKLMGSSINIGNIGNLRTLYNEIAKELRRKNK